MTHKKSPNGGNPRQQPTPFQLATGGKVAELAVYYNIAVDTVLGYINTKQHVKIEDDVLKDPVKIAIQTLHYLRRVLWKGAQDDKNKSGQPLLPDEKNMVCALLKKLYHIRNFHSHVWHDSKELTFDKTIVDFVVAKHDAAVLELSVVKGYDAKLYLETREKFNLFDEHNGRWIITQEGRVFFLSFFLNKGDMTALLQQRTGSKRNDEPKFKFKHQLYTFYCQREGAAWDSTNLSTEELTTADAEETNRIMNKQKAYRIMRYLNDRPALYGEAATLPLYYTTATGTADLVTDMPGLKAYIVQKGLLPQIKIGLLKLREDTLPDDAADEEKVANERAKILEQKKREGIGYIKWTGNEQYEFEINYATLRHIAGDVVLKRRFERVYVENDEQKQKQLGAAEHFYEVLKAAIESREYIYQQLIIPDKENPLHHTSFKMRKLFNSAYINYNESIDIIDKVFYTNDELRHAPLMATPKIEKLLIEWHQSFTAAKPQMGECNRRKKLLNYIRSADKPFDKTPYKNNAGKVGLPDDTEPQPMVFHLSHYYKEQVQQLRQEDRFLEWGLQYLLDFGYLQGCLVEQLGETEVGVADEYKVRRSVNHVAALQGRNRPRIIDGQVNVIVPATTNRPKVILRIGEKVMKYLLCVLRDKKWPLKQPIATGFFTKIANEYCQLLANPQVANGLQYLAPFAIPAGLQQAKPAVPSLRQELAGALTKKIDWLQRALDNRPTYNRHQKNRILLEAYLLYDFTTVAHGKYLRKNEYEQMSVCHYMLNQNPDKVMGLLLHTFKLKERLPLAVCEAIQEALGSDALLPRLDVLYNNILNNRLEFLKTQRNNVLDDTIPVKITRKSLQYINLPLSEANLQPEAKENRLTKRSESYAYLPFAVHPALVLKYFDPEAFANKKFDGSSSHRAGEQVYTNPFAVLRAATAGKAAIVAAHYAEEPLLVLYNTAPVAEQKKWKQLKGRLIDLHTKDVLLSEIAGQYLQAYDMDLYEDMQQAKDTGQLSITQLFDKPIVVKLLKSDAEDYLKKVSELKDTDIAGLPDVLYMKLQLHQSDDIFYRSKREVLYPLAWHYQQLRQEELAYYKDRDEDIYQQILKWPQATANDPVPFGHLLQEYKKVGNMACVLMDKLLKYELALIETYVKREKSANPHREEQLIMGATTKDGSYMSFIEVLLLDGENTEAVKEQLRLLRNQCMHKAIPAAGSYSQQATPGSAVAEVLGITKRLAPDREKYKLYEKGVGN